MPGVYYINVASQILFYAIFALGLNVLVGYGGLVSLGHAGLFGIAAYATGYHAAGRLRPSAGDPDRAGASALVSMAVYAVLSLRATGIGFIMITLALGRNRLGPRLSLDQRHRRRQRHQPARPARAFRLCAQHGRPRSITRRWSCSLVAVAAVAIFVRSPLGAALKGTRDQPRRMNALGYHVWAIRFWACLFSGLLTAVAGILFVYYTQFISPQTLALTSSAEVLLMVISGGAGTLLGPIVGAALVVIVKSVVSGFIERWNMLLGAIFVAIVILMPEGLVPGSARLWRLALAQARATPRPRKRGGEAMSALTVSGLAQVLRRPARHRAASTSTSSRASGG